MKFLQLNFIPRSTDFALLVLRVWLGLTMLMVHGWAKLAGFSAMLKQFGDPIGIGPLPSLVLLVLAEVACSALLVLGLFTRFAALALTIAMSVAFFSAHKMVLSGPASGEIAFLFLAGYVTLFFAGAGRFSVDRKLGGAA